VAEKEQNNLRRQLAESEVALRGLREAKELAEDIFNTVREPLLVLDADLRVISANRSFYQTFKVAPEETEGQLIYDLGNRQWDIPRLRELLEQILPEDTKFDNFEVEHDFPTIGRRVMLLNARRVCREAHKTQMILLAIEDITERKQAEKQLLHLSAMLRALRSINQLITRERDSQRLIQRGCKLLVEARSYGLALILLIDEAGNYISAAEAGAFPPEGGWPAFLERLKRGDYPRCFNQALKRDKPFTILEPTADECRHCDFACARVSDTAFVDRLEYEGKVYGAILTRVPSEFAQNEEEQGLFHELVSDITFALNMIERREEHRRLEVELRQSEARYRDLADLLPETVIELDAKGNITFANRNAFNTFGYTQDDFDNGLNAFQMIIPQDRDRARGNIVKILSGEKLGGIEYTALRKDGSTFPVVAYASPILKEGKGVGLRMLVTDITERRQAEEALREAKEQAEQYLSIAEVMLATIDTDENITLMNKKGYEILGYKEGELIGKNWFDTLVPERIRGEIRGIFYKLMAGDIEPVEYYENPLLTRDGEERLIAFHNTVIRDPNGKIVGALLSAEDITERKRMQEQLMVTDRLASIGQLASGIAHELNNPLTSVIGFSDLLLGKEDLPDDVREDLKIINREAQRTSQVVKNLLTFARKHGQAKQPVSINSLIGQVLEMRAYEQRVNNIEVNTQFAPDLPEIVADSFQLQQVFLNIIINAEYFMIEAHKGGTLTITTQRAGDIIRISFADDGPGIAKENLGHLFDPFFTTKEVGKGTGLGLSICHGIITEHGGRIYAESELGKGATFIIELPIK